MKLSPISFIWRRIILDFEKKVIFKQFLPLIGQKFSVGIEFRLFRKHD